MKKPDYEDVQHAMEEIARKMLDPIDCYFDLYALQAILVDYIKLRAEEDGSIPILLDKYQHDCIRKDANWTKEYTDEQKWPYEGKLIKVKVRSEKA